MGFPLTKNPTTVYSFVSKVTVFPPGNTPGDYNRVYTFLFDTIKGQTRIYFDFYNKTDFSSNSNYIDSSTTLEEHERYYLYQYLFDWCTLKNLPTDNLFLIYKQQSKGVEKWFVPSNLLGLKFKFKIAYCDMNYISNYIRQKFNLDYYPYREGSTNNNVMGYFYINDIKYYYFAYKTYEVYGKFIDGSYTSKVYDAADYAFYSSDDIVYEEEKKCCLAECFGITE